MARTEHDRPRRRRPPGPERYADADQARRPGRPEPPSRPPRRPVGPPDDQGQNPGQRYVVLEQQHVSRGRRRPGSAGGRRPVTAPAGPDLRRVSQDRRARSRTGTASARESCVCLRPRRPAAPECVRRPVGPLLCAIRQIGEPVATTRPVRSRRPRGVAYTRAALPRRAAN